MKISGKLKDQILIALAAIVANIISAFNDFHTDDWAVLNILKDGLSWKEFLSMETTLYFRPLTNIIVYLRVLLFGSSPYGYHIVNILLNAIVCILLYHFLMKIKFSRPAAIISAILFAVYFQHYEAVIWIYGIIRILVAMFWFLSLITLYNYIEDGRKNSLAIFSIITFLGFFVCEDFIISPIVFAAFVIIMADKEILRRRLLPVLFCSLAGILIYFILRHSLIHFSPFTENLYFAGLHIFQKFFEYMSWMVIPSPDHDYFRSFSAGLGPGLYWLWKLVTWLSGALMILGGLYLLINFPKAIKFFVLFVLLSLLPALPFTFKVASRYIYIPSIGLAAILGYLVNLLIGKLSERRVYRGIVISCFGLFLIIHVMALAITSLQYHKTEQEVRSMIEDIRDSKVELSKYQFVLLDHLPGRTAPGPAFSYYFESNDIVASNDANWGPIDIPRAVADLTAQGKTFIVFDYQNGHLREATRQYVP